VTDDKLSLTRGNFGQKMFTVITMAYWKLPLLKQTIESVLNQTYKNIEFIIVNNGASNDIIAYINKLKEEDERVVIINYEENLFRFDDPEFHTFVCCDAALKAAKGDYIFYTSYDDPLSLDYVERMVRLFENNPKCTTAAGRFVSIDMDNNVNEEELNNRKTNFRPMYMPGHILVLEMLKGNTRLFATAGGIFSIRKDVLLKYGGWHRSNEVSHLLGIVPFGETGFDEDAIYFWRRHEGQLNKTLTARGHTGFQEIMLLLYDFDIFNRWKIYGDETAKYVVRKTIQRYCEGSARIAVNNLFQLRLQAFLYTFKVTHKEMWFNVMLIKIFFFVFPRVYIRILRYPISSLAKMFITFLDIKTPNLKYRFELFDRLVKRVSMSKRCKGAY